VQIFYKRLDLIRHNNFGDLLAKSKLANISNTLKTSEEFFCALPFFHFYPPVSSQPFLYLFTLISGHVC
jgi:hypothetical protein